MKYQRLDKKCNAKVLAISDDRVLIKAEWPAKSADYERFNVVTGTAFNTMHVSKRYFEEKYGVKL